jgi:cubilin
MKSSLKNIVFVFQVRDGGSSSSPVMGTFCGPQVPDPQTTTGNLMYLKFVTDGSVQNLGFEATYEAGEGGCGGQLTDDTGTSEYFFRVINK